MAKVIGTFTQTGKKKNTSTDELRISQSSDGGSFYIQLVKQDKYGSSERMMHFCVDPDDLDDLITVLQYAKKVTEGG